jgi:hypothetical protein
MPVRMGIQNGGFIRHPIPGFLSKPEARFGDRGLNSWPTDTHALSTANDI